MTLLVDNLLSNNGQPGQGEFNPTPFRLKVLTNYVMISLIVCRIFLDISNIIQRTLAKNVHTCNKIDPKGYVIIILLRQKQNHKNLNRHHEWVPLF